jgi:mannose/cellobiose epimerase-like protein (N-acyl-D-glucosamine 2-epimerase family)
MADLTHVARSLRSWIVDAYDLWWTRGADQLSGGFHERLNQDGSSTDEARRARLHPRQMFAYSHAAGLGWRGPSTAAVAHGLKFFLARYRRPDGFFRALISPRGATLSDAVLLYDQAFALLGLAAAYSALEGERARTIALDLHDLLRTRLAHRAIGFEETLQRDTPLSANSHMHLLEASLAWMELDNSSCWSELAAELVDLATTRLIDRRSGAVTEAFGSDWQPPASRDIVEPGHQFEWAWLLLRFRARGERSGLLSTALRLIEIGETFGVDRTRRAVVASLDQDLRVRDANARLWPQCERIKAALMAFAATGEARYQEIAAAGAETLLGYLATPLRGLWRDRLDGSGAFIEEPAPASSFYHIVGAILELTASLPRHESPTDYPRAGAGSAC